ncbi:MAG TPA: hypothetical protein DIW17_00620 [Clostridiales bacterium]|nr:hypothetical protein [Clostridiales bacterium]
MKKLLSIILAAILIFTMAACTPSEEEPSDKTAEPTVKPVETTEPVEEDPILTGEKPELNILTWYTPYNMEEQPPYNVVEEITGYKINWFNLPLENSDDKLMLEVSGGSSYDLLMRINSQPANQLQVQNALMDIKLMLEKYGNNILSAVSDMALDSVTTEDGMIYGIPHEAFSGTGYGVMRGGIGFNTKYLDDLGMELPTNLDDFYTVLKAYTNKTDKPALTTVATGWVSYIMAGFGMGDAGWYEVDGEYLPRIKHPAMVDYLAFMQKLYKENLLDNDMPINTGATAIEKLTNGTVLAYPIMFWDIDSIYQAFDAVGMDAKIEVATHLAKDAETDPVIYVAQGVSYLTLVPKTAKNPEHAVNWFNTISDNDNFKEIYIGEEGVAHEVKDGAYYPLFPTFNDYNHADMYVGVNDAENAFQMWQARARKTDAMAEMYEQMNARADEYKVISYYEPYAASLEAVRNNQSALNTMVNDKLIQAIASGEDAQTVVDDIIEEWENTGGLDYETAMKEWYAANKDLFD